MKTCVIPLAVEAQRQYWVAPDYQSSSPQSDDSSSSACTVLSDGVWTVLVFLPLAGGGSVLQLAIHSLLDGGHRQ